MNRKIWYTVKSLLPAKYYNHIIRGYYCLISLFYIGDRVFCPCCGMSSGRFKPHGTCGECPRCGSKEIHRLLTLYLKKKTDLMTSTCRMLHTAPEYSLQLALKGNKKLEYVSIDLNSQRAQIKMDLTDLKFADSSFDMVLSCNVLEHIDNDSRAMSEILRVMKPGAWALIQVPVAYENEKTIQDASFNTDTLRRRFYGHHDHKRLYGMDFPERLSAIGFRVESISFPAEFSEEEICKFGLRKSTIIYRCSKPDR